MQQPCSPPTQAQPPKWKHHTSCTNSRLGRSSWRSVSAPYPNPTPPTPTLTLTRQVEVAQRLGSSARAADDVVSHAWFEAMDMDALINLVAQARILGGVVVVS